MYGKKIFTIILVLTIAAALLAGCGSITAGRGKDEAVESLLPGESGGIAKTRDGEIKFYPTYDDNYKTGTNEKFDFWFDIPADWKAVDRSGDGSAYDILPGNDKVKIRIYGVMKNEPEEEFYNTLAGGGAISDFVFRDGWTGKMVETSDSKTYYVRVDGDSYIVLFVSADEDPSWAETNREKISCMAESLRITRESYGVGTSVENSITLDDLELGGIKINMSCEKMLEVIGQKSEKEEVEEYEGLEAKTLFFPDNTQVYVVDGVVYSVNVTSADYATPRGLKIGDDEERVLELYGEPSSKEEGIWGYCYNGYELFTIVISGGKVVEMQVDAGM